MRFNAEGLTPVNALPANENRWGRRAVVGTRRYNKTKKASDLKTGADDKRERKKMIFVACAYCTWQKKKQNHHQKGKRTKM